MEEKTEQRAAGTNTPGGGGRRPFARSPVPTNGPESAENHRATTNIDRRSTDPVGVGIPPTSQTEPLKKGSAINIGFCVFLGSSTCLFGSSTVKKLLTFFFKF